MTAPSSQFAALLRRSKFASYDPSIGQVYSSFDGHLHRGNFGLKRPLPIRGRQAHVTVRSVDSREEQTEWKGAENEAQFMKMWDDAGITPALKADGPWATKIGANAEVAWNMDSEFAPANGVAENQSATSRAAHGPTSSAVPNIHAMSDKEFAAYLDKLRQMRPDFASYLKELAARKAEHRGTHARSEFSSFWEYSEKPSKDYRTFLGSQAYKTYNSPESRAIEQ